MCPRNYLSPELPRPDPMTPLPVLTGAFSDPFSPLTPFRPFIRYSMPVLTGFSDPFSPLTPFRPFHPLLHAGFDRRFSDPFRPRFDGPRFDALVSSEIAPRTYRMAATMRTMLRTSKVYPTISTADAMRSPRTPRPFRISPLAIWPHAIPARHPNAPSTTPEQLSTKPMIAKRRVRTPLLRGSTGLARRSLPSHGDAAEFVLRVPNSFIAVSISVILKYSNRRKDPTLPTNAPTTE